MDEMTEDVIAKALEGARVRISRAEHERAEADRAIAAAREEERLLLRLLALRRGAVPTSDEVAPGGQDAQTCGAEPGPTQAAGNSMHPAVQTVVQELAAAGRPLHISELMRQLREREVQIPGAGTQANLITHLRRDARLVRPSRGMYGLAAWGLQNMPTTPRRKRRRRRVRSSATAERNAS